MPELARFEGITIRMHLRGKEHNPPHVHADYGEFEAAFEIHSGNMYSGMMPLKQRLKTKDWILEHQEYLLDLWDKQVFGKVN